MTATTDAPALRVALLGCGTVGAEVVRLLHSSGDDLAALLDRLPGCASGDPALPPEPGAAELIGAGYRLRLVDGPTSWLLQAVYVDGLSGAEAAGQHATTPGSLHLGSSVASASC